MAWSTRELADLAGTTVNTVRHYHRVGLMPVPERRGNGYKQYGVRDLVRLLRIRRLVELGVPLSEVGELGAGESSVEVLRELDAELAQRMEKLAQARASIATILRERTPLDVPAGFESVGARMSEADRSIVHVYSRLYDEQAMGDLRQMIESESREVTDRFVALPENADEHERAALAELLGADIARSLADFPWLTEQGPHLAQSPALAQEAFVQAVVELYNPAQRDVLMRAGTIAQALHRAATGSHSAPSEGA